MRLLIVDDSQMMRAAIREAVSPFGWDEVLEAENGEEAIGQLGRTAVDAIITDWSMPVMDGLTLVAAVRCTPDLRRTPILMVTSIAEKGKILEAVQAGISGYLIKPFAPATLQRKLAEIMADGSRGPRQM
jgi:two-component system, chemotaxis family, chemotaxis protein CheY